MKKFDQGPRREGEGGAVLRDIRVQIYGILYYLNEYWAAKLDAQQLQRLESLGVAASRTDSIKGLSDGELAQRLSQNLTELTDFAQSAGVPHSELTHDKLIAFESAQASEDYAYLKAFRDSLEVMPDLNSTEDDEAKPKFPIN